MSGSYDEALLRLHRTGPEFRAGLANHGPMAIDALVRMDQGDDLDGWLDGYIGKLDELPAPRWRIQDRDDWRDPLGDPTRLGDWLEFFQRQLAQAPWPEVLTTWWPRLLPGAVASATHPLIRTGHAVRSLLDQDTGPRVEELGQALGYWAARWTPLPAARPVGRMGPGAALTSLPPVPDRGGARARIAALFDESSWAATVSRGRAPADPREVESALDDLVDAAVSHYNRWAAAQPVMLVHMATAPRAARLVLPALPRALWSLTYVSAWRVSAAIASMYRPTQAALSTEPAPPNHSPNRSKAVPSEAEVAAAAARHGDEHVIKFTEVTLESHRRGNPDAIAAARSAIRQIT
jgi:hypothetical protein